MDDTVAENAALLALAGTVTTAGTATDVLLLAILTLNELPVGAVLKATVQASVPELFIVDALHDSADSTGVGVPVPLKEMAGIEPLVVSTALTSAVIAPVAVGEKWTWISQLAPAARLDPQVDRNTNDEAFAPVTPMLGIVRGVPRELVSVTACEALAVPTV